MGTVLISSMTAPLRTKCVIIRLFMTSKIGGHKYAKIFHISTVIPYMEDGARSLLLEFITCITEKSSLTESLQVFLYWVKYHIFVFEHGNNQAFQKQDSHEGTPWLFVQLFISLRQQWTINRIKLHITHHAICRPLSSYMIVQPGR